MRANSIVLIAAMILGQAAFAQGGQTITNIQVEDSTVKNPWTVRANGAAMILGGFGLNAGRALSKNVSVEALYNQTRMKDNDDDTIKGFEAIHNTRTYGLRADYLFNGADKSGIYGSLSAVNVELKSEVDPIFSNQKRTITTNETGAQGFGGYQIISQEKSFNLAARLGLGYGMGGKVATTLGATRNEVGNGLLLDISVGAMF
jgi:hypothetical protein